jgi:hypothetical protein
MPHFEIRNSLFDIQDQRVWGIDKNFIQNLFGSGLPGLGFTDAASIGL